MKKELLNKGENPSLVDLIVTNNYLNSIILRLTSDLCDPSNFQSLVQIPFKNNIHNNLHFPYLGEVSLILPPIVINSKSKLNTIITRSKSTSNNQSFNKYIQVETVFISAFIFNEDAEGSFAGKLSSHFSWRCNT